MDGWLPTVLGSVAGLLSTVSFVPQVRKALREGDTGATSKRVSMVTVSLRPVDHLRFVIGAVPSSCSTRWASPLSGTILFLKIRNDQHRGAAAGG
jgi:MtN3 and saliva related transmembrane protein